MGTSGGASATGLRIGSIAPGSYADLMALDLDDPSLQPTSALRAHLVHSIEATAIRDVFVQGERVVVDQRPARVPVRRIAEKLEAAVAKLADARHQPRRSS